MFDKEIEILISNEDNVKFKEIIREIRCNFIFLCPKIVS